MADVCVFPIFPVRPQVSLQRLETCTFIILIGLEFFIVNVFDVEHQVNLAHGPSQLM